MAKRLKRRWCALFGVAGLVGVVVLVGRLVAAPRYQGPKSDHFDGRVFHNLGPFVEPSFLDLFKWQLSGGSVKWPDWRDVPKAPPPLPRAEGPRVTFVNHATCLIQMDGLNLVTDPVWSERVGPVSWFGPKRHKAAGIAWDELPKIDAILISHNHYDHLDLPTIERIVRRDSPVILAGLGTRALFERRGIGARAVDLDWWQSHELGKLRITFAPAQHWSTRGLGDRRTVLWGSYFISNRERSVYFAGDTGDGPHFRAIRDRLGAPTLALLPIGAYEPRWFMRPQHINPEEAVAAHATLGAKRSMGMHWGTFDQTDEGIDDPRDALVAARVHAGLPEDAFVVVDNGGVVEAP